MSKKEKTLSLLFMIVVTVLLYLSVYLCNVITSMKQELAKVERELVVMKDEISQIDHPPQFQVYVNEVKEEKVQTINHNVCSTSTFKSYMDFRAITDTSSKQYALQTKAHTSNGYRIVDDRIMIAIANFKVGTKLDIELASGEKIETIVGDVKANTSCEHPDSSMIEFIVDTRTMDPEVKYMGNFNIVHSGSVIKLTEIIQGS